MLGCKDRLTGSKVEMGRADRQHGYPKRQQMQHLLLTLSDGGTHTLYHGVLHVRDVTRYMGVVYVLTCSSAFRASVLTEVTMPQSITFGSLVPIRS
jgi:hypothetical protein